MYDFIDCLVLSFCLDLMFFVLCKRYPIDQYDRIWDADEDFSPFHVSSGFDIQANFSMSVLKESPPVAVLQTGRVLARWLDLTYKFPIDHQGDFHIVLYFAGILPVSPSFDVLINGHVVRSNYTVNRWEVSSLFFTMKGIESLNITLKTVHYYPYINALEVYEILDIPLETSSTTGSNTVLLFFRPLKESVRTNHTNF